MSRAAVASTSTPDTWRSRQKASTGGTRSNRSRAHCGAVGYSSEKILSSDRFRASAGGHEGLRGLKRSPLALARDLYSWATYRVYQVNRKGHPDIHSLE